MAAFDSPDAAPLLAEADLLEAEADATMESDPMWRKRVNQQAWRRTRGRPAQ